MAKIAIDKLIQFVYIRYFKLIHNVFSSKMESSSNLYFSTIFQYLRSEAQTSPVSRIILQKLRKHIMPMLQSHDDQYRELLPKFQTQGMVELKPDILRHLLWDLGEEVLPGSKFEVG
mmetsp:Transcript_18459/g.25994  ORF Transcript_18459/g.25994 Transcript_18459/m.25994 type:complete len:117 (-) Transcript_18459:1121-1471(-)